MIRQVVALLALLAVLAGCGSERPDDHYYATAVCVDGNGIRVPDNYCPIGDGITNAGYGWDYHEYRDTDPVVNVVYVGYPVDRTLYTPTRPRRVPTLNIDRGRFPEVPTAADAGATQAQVPTIAAERKSTITRGGLGVSKDARNAEAPAPVRTLDSPAPGRKATPAPLPPPPPKRVVAKVKTTKTT